jgi:hypothetical protein
MRTKAKTKFTRLALCASVTTLLAACGGGGGNTSSSTGNQQPSLQAATQLTGTVAVGTALPNTIVTVTDANGTTASGTSNSSGQYSIGITGLTAPLVLTATDPAGAQSLMYSVVASTNTASGAPVTANVTPLTTAVAALMTQSGNPGSLIGNASAITSSAITTAEATLDAALAPILSQNSVAANFDPIGATFTANQAGADAVIDSVAVTPSATGTGLQITSLANANAPIALNSSTSVSTALAAPAQPANFLAGLQSSLSQCMADVQSGATASSDGNCTTAIDASWLHDGFSGNQFEKQRHTSLFAKGATLTGIKTLAFFPANTFPNVSNPTALVYFLDQHPNGTPGFESEIVQQLPSGSWDIIGNQDQFDNYIAAFVGRKQFVDAADANNGRYESGLEFDLPSTVTVSGTTTQVGSANVQGPGLPSGGVWLYESTTSDRMLTVNTTAVSSPFIGGTSTPSAGGGWWYNWAWSPISGSGSVTVPTTADYATSSQDVSQIQQFGLYTVQLYGTTGTAIGNAQTVLNIAPVEAPQAGSAVAWQSLGSDVISNLLTVGGSEANTVNNGGLASLPLDWTIPVGASYPGLEVNLIQASAQTANNAASARMDSWSSPTVTLNGSTASTTLAAGDAWGEAEGSSPATISTVVGQTATLSANLMLEWQAGGDYYLNGTVDNLSQ